MMDGIQARAEALARRRAGAIRAAIASADLPAGLTATRDGDDVIVSGRGLARGLSFDPRLAAIGLIARDA